MKSGSETSFGCEIKILIRQLKSSESNLSYPVVHGDPEVAGTPSPVKQPKQKTPKNHLSHWRTAVKGFTFRDLLLSGDKERKRLDLDPSLRYEREPLRLSSERRLLTETKRDRWPR